MDDHFSFSAEEELGVGDMFNWALISPDPFGPILTVGRSASTPQSAFAEYRRHGKIPSLSPIGSNFQSGDTNYRNSHRRMLEFLRRIPDAGQETGGAETSRGFRHMMRERERREKLSQGYASLHSVLPFASKGDKISVVQSAVAHLQHLKKRKEELERRSAGICSEIARKEEEKDCVQEVMKVDISVDASSAIGSVIGAIKCLKSMDVKARSIQFYFAGTDLSAIVGIGNKKGAKVEAERALYRAFKEAEKKLPTHS